MNEPTPEDIQRVFTLWKSYRPRPELCRLTGNRRKLIRTRLKDWTPEDLCVLVRYANEADTSEARFWRGQNDRGQEYLDLVNLLRGTKMDGRVERAHLWADEQDRRTKDEDEGLDLGPMGQVLRVIQGGR